MIRIHRSPEGADSAGATVLEAPETAAPAAPEAPVAEIQKEAPKEKPQFSEWDRYLKVQEKAKDPNAKYTKADLALAKKYEGKDESLIQGYKPREQQADDDESPAPEIKEKPPEVKENPLHKMVGAKSDAELVPKVQGLVDELKKFAGERGEAGRVFQAMGAKNAQEASTYVKNANALHQLVQDLKAGKPEAFKYIGVNGAPPQQEKFTGEIPGDILDEGLYKHFTPQLKAALERAEKLEQKVAALEGDLTPFKESQAKSTAEQQRAAQVTSIVSEVSQLAESTEGLWDSKKHGSLSKALNEYYSTSGDYNPGLKPIVEILDIAKEKGIQDLEIALAYWERKNGGSLIAKAREDARQPFVGKKPSVGLSDQQGNRNGTFKSYTEAQVKEMATGRVPVPKEWKDSYGTLIRDKVPAHLHALIFKED